MKSSMFVAKSRLDFRHVLHFPEQRLVIEPKRSRPSVEIPMWATRI